MLAIEQAIFARWNAASLNSSVATLYSGDGNDQASPENTVMPRASFHIADDRQIGRSRGNRLNMAALVLHLYATTRLAVLQYLALIDTAFVNADQAATATLQVSESAGHIIDVDFVGQTVEEEGDNVFHGVMTLDVQYTKPNRVPA